MIKLKVNKTMTTDVLVVGGGGAGVYAAVEAIRAGVNVIIVSKGKVGNSGNTIMIGGSYSMDGYSAKHVYGFEKADDSLTKELLLEQIIKQSFFLSEQDVAEQYVEDSPHVYMRCITGRSALGRSRLLWHQAVGCWRWHSLGRGLLQGLIENPGTVMVEDVMIDDLLKKDGQIIGAIGVDVYSGEVIGLRQRQLS